MTDRVLKPLLEKLNTGYTASKEDILFLLEQTGKGQIRHLFQAAQQTRERFFGTQVFLYGFLYFSTHCRNNCRFCHYRSSNNRITRYRKVKTGILSAARAMADSGVHLTDLTMGEDPRYYNGDEQAFEELVDLVATVKAAVRHPVMVSFGALPDAAIRKIRRHADWFACYQETHNPDLFKTLRPGQDYNRRLTAKMTARHNGMLIEEGILTGVGESVEDIADSILWMREHHVDQARVMTFVPQPDTPLSGIKARDSLMEQKIIAVMRLVLKECLIPASLDVDGLDGLPRRLDAGANVVTSIVPAAQGLCGVANHSLDIEESRRSLNHVLPVLASRDLEAASTQAYQTWVRKRLDREKLRPDHGIKTAC